MVIVPMFYPAPAMGKPCGAGQMPRLALTSPAAGRTIGGLGRNRHEYRSPIFVRNAGLATTNRKRQVRRDVGRSPTYDARAEAFASGYPWIWRLAAIAGLAARQSRAHDVNVASPGAGRKLRVPDLVLLTPDRSASTMTHFEGAPTVVVEIRSPATTIEKLPFYTSWRAGGLADRS